MLKTKTIVVMPAYNAEKTLEKTISDLPFSYIDEIIFVDDASKDETIKNLKDFCAKSDILTLNENDLNSNSTKKLLTYLVHDKNKGYGANQKSCYDLALKRKGDIVVMIHPDYQYDPKLTKYFVEYIKDNYFDVMLGSRIRSRREALAGGMPWYKYFANRFLSLIENIITGYNLSEWHTGMRAYKKEVLEKVNYNQFSDDFIFDSQMLFTVIRNNYRIGDIPVPVRYFKEASSINFKRSLKYGILTLKEIIKFSFFRLKRNKVSRYIISGIIALLANLLTLFILVHVFNKWYLTSAIISFMVGLVISYLMQKFFTFENKTIKRIPIQFLFFSIFNLMMLGLNTILMYLGVDLLNFYYLFSQIITTFLISFINYYFFNKFIFKKA